MRELRNYKNSRGKVWLNIASSMNVLKDYVNLDNNIILHFVDSLKLGKFFIPKKYWIIFDRFAEAKQQALLIKHDCRKPLFFPDNSIDHILCSYFLDYVYPAEADKILIDFHRVLKPNATLHVIVDDLRDMVERYLHNNNCNQATAGDDFIRESVLSRESRGSFHYRILELQGGFGLQHRWLYDSLSITKKIKDAGFDIVDAREIPSNRYRSDDCRAVHVFARKP